MENWRRRGKGPQCETEKFVLDSEPTENTELFE